MMKRAIVVLVMTWAGVASADRRIALAVERDNLLPLDDAPVSVVVQQPSALDRKVTAEPDHARLWLAIDTTVLVASTAALAIDWRQTRNAAVERWSGGRWEGGYPAQMTLGAHPSTHSVDGYFALAAATNIAFWTILPARWRSVIPGIVIGAEASTIVGNLSTTHL